MEKACVFSINRHRIGIDGHGITTLVGLSGCPLKCPYCLNPKCKNKGLEISTSELLEKVKVDNLYFLASGGGVTFGGGEPLLQYEFIKSFMDLCDSRWRINIESSLNVPLENVIHLVQNVDQWIIDIKDLNEKRYSKYTGKNNDYVLKNLLFFVENNLQNKSLIRVPLIPGYNTIKDVRSSVKRLKEMGFNTFDEFTYQVKFNHE